MKFSGSAALQLRSIYALMMRNMRQRFAGSRAGYLWAIIEPICWIIVLKMAIAGHGNTRPPLGDSFEVFFANGIIIARMWKQGVNSIEPTLNKQRRLALPAIHKLDQTYARWLLDTATCFVVLLVLLGALGAVGFEVIPDNAVICIAAFAAASLFTLAFGLTFSLVLALAPGLVHFKMIFILIGFLTSGFAVLTDRMPPQLRQIFLWNPLTHCIEWYREGFYRGYECVSLDLEYLFSVIVGLMLLGLAGERALRRAGVRRGGARREQMSGMDA